MTHHSKLLLLVTTIGITQTFCGTEEHFNSNGDMPSSSDSSSNTTSNSGSDHLLEKSSLALEVVRVSASSSEDFAHLEYKNADFAFVIRCNSAWTLRRANGLPARTPSGRLTEMSPLESQSVWESAIATSSQCTFFGEKLIRASLSDPLALSGTYFYLLRPCKVQAPKSHSSTETFECSESLLSSPDIRINNSITERKRKIYVDILSKENQLVGVTLRLRSHLSAALEAQLKCEENTAIDAVREAKLKALRTVLSTSIAAAVGGAIAGPAAALTAAKQTLSWITEYFGSGTQANPSQCTLLKDAEQQAEFVADEIDVLTKKISQLKSELARL